MARKGWRGKEELPCKDGEDSEDGEDGEEESTNQQGSYKATLLIQEAKELSKSNFMLE